MGKAIFGRNASKIAGHITIPSVSIVEVPIEKIVQVYVPQETIVYKEIIKEVPVEKEVFITKEVIKEVPVETLKTIYIEKPVYYETIKEVPVEKIVEIPRIVIKIKKDRKSIAIAALLAFLFGLVLGR